MESARLAIPGTAMYPELPGATSEDAALVSIISNEDPDRHSLQRFIADIYMRDYGARIEHFAEKLIGMRRCSGAWVAGCGYTLAGDNRLFIEQYLDHTVENAIAKRVGIHVRRDEVVEVGNLAAFCAGYARRVIVYTTALLNQLHRTWVVFTATRSLLNSFARLRIEPIFLAQANPSRLVDRGAHWGSYYDTCPQVVAANIPQGFVHLFSQHNLANTVLDL
jgi:hypothetical protein